MESFDQLSKYINYSMCQNRYYKELHDKNRFKNYSFGNFYPVEKTRIYKNGNIYNFTIRSLDENFIDEMQKLLRENINHSHIQVLQTVKSKKKQFFVSELYTVTPAIVTTENGRFWTMQSDGDIIKLQKQLQDNLEKKYQKFYGEKIEAAQNFIQLLEIKNQKPQSIYFTKESKSIRLFGNKCKIVPNDDEVSQKLAFVALACGVGEKSSYGAGFVLAKGMR